MRILLTIVMGAMLACAADPFYIGTWKIDSATTAPWADAQRTPLLSEKQALVGKTVVIAAKEITGPRQVACKGPHYEVKDYSADMLFQGSFGEMHERDKNVDPVKVAAKAGFKGTSWKTLETGCAMEIDFHFADPKTAMFGLNNVIYVLKKQ